MTVSNEDSRTGPYNGDGSTTNFDFDFLLLAKAHLVVTLTAADGTSTEQALGADYTIPDGDVGNPNGGTVTMSVAPASGEQITITREVTRDQQVDLQNRGSFFPETIERALDKLTQITQDHRELLERSIKQAVTETDELTFPASADGQAIGWDGNQLVNISAVDGATLLSLNEVLGKTVDGAEGILIGEEEVLGRRFGGGLKGLTADDVYTILRDQELVPEAGAVSQWQHSQVGTRIDADTFTIAGRPQDLVGDHPYENVGRRVLALLENTGAYRWGTVSSASYNGTSDETTVNLVEIIDSSGSSATLLDEPLTVWAGLPSAGSLTAVPNSKGDGTFAQYESDADGTAIIQHPDTAAQAGASGVDQAVASVSALRAGSFPSTLDRLWLSGYYGLGTPGGGPFYRDAGDTTSADNDGTILVDADGIRWKRPQAMDLDVTAFGSTGDGSTDDSTAIQAAIDAVRSQSVASPTSAGSTGRQQVLVPGGEYVATVDMGSGFDGCSLRGVGVGSHVWTEAADHTLHIQNPGQNINLYNMWVDQSAVSGAYDAVHIDPGGEIRLVNMDVDFAPRYAIFINAGGCTLDNVQVTGGGKTAGIYLETNATGCMMSNVRLNLINHGTSADAMVIQASRCSLNGITIDTVDNRGVIINGDRNYLNCNITGTIGDALQVSGNSNHITGHIDGNLVLTSTSQNNLITATISGTITNNGTGNNIIT